jgi:hypothetical protein
MNEFNLKIIHHKTHREPFIEHIEKLISKFMNKNRPTKEQHKMEYNELHGVKFAVSDSAQSFCLLYNFLRSCNSFFIFFVTLEKRGFYFATEPILKSEWSVFFLDRLLVTVRFEWVREWKTAGCQSQSIISFLRNGMK